MFIIAKDLPKNSIGIKASGETTALNYDGINPVLEIRDEFNRKAKLFIEISDFDASASQFFEDVKSSFNHLDDICAMAVVADKIGLHKDSDLFSFLFPGLLIKEFGAHE
ncbi:STAS/SEC14 domain-containing protein [Subsaximicrobium wynnwilliamsii]|uniref:STAS/SEC14 domain-containing protein n=1 Tax=Subsaximicrobium wynnwilliamsii TaxID=291179 RepID=A0A5C6ZKM7_9FLAO|nr:STAS/SEC14 domain-containing protein [Subsaximicrobium wynnwilliamsii]TXD84885.1 STAS/SEC14 domain-containing protein [Subsaximicrobium wynnwilliamsii]TXD90556.1 STAS/SEC14 domain-containing protein [Subsaximicrobium wynnwilliamsii]TXE05031.1 STAS/SEC14 domain-containing protein [Subsaximicrobium wynnwilliamsii]